MNLLITLDRDLNYHLSKHDIPHGDSDVIAEVVTHVPPNEVWEVHHNTVQYWVCQRTNDILRKYLPEPVLHTD